MSDAASSAFSSLSVAKTDFQHLISELREQNFDTIRFATYRAACKLKFVQKKVNLHLVDIWNIIESFRENGLNAVEYGAEVKVSRIELLLSTVYHNLNKRLPVAQQIDTDRSIGLLLSFLLGAYDRDDSGRLRVFSLKVALATMCAGKLLDKLRYIFSQISDSAGVMENHKFLDYLREVLALPTAIFEAPTFGYTETAAKSCFGELNSKISVNSFLDTLMSDPCPPCLMWLPLLHRMASVEHVFHPVVCDACAKDSFTGFRYRCQRCHNYQLCQDCFWRGRTSGSHSNQHEMKEYCSYKSPVKQLGHSIGKSLRCAPTQSLISHPAFPDHPDRPLDLANVVPATPSLLHNSHMQAELGMHYDELNPLDTSAHSRFLFSDAVNLDDEHKLIARYSAKLAGRTTFPSLGRGVDFGQYPDENLNQRAMIARLEQRNKEILREIQEIQAMQLASGQMPLPPGLNESGLSTELDTLRVRKMELEGRMRQLQNTRKDLMSQLEHLMRMLKTQTPHEGSPRSPSSLSGVGGEVRQAFRDATPIGSLGTVPNMTGSLGRLGTLPSGGPPKTGTLQGDLLSAADSITNTMSTLVKELGTAEAEDDISATSNGAPNETQQLNEHQNQQHMERYARK